MKNEKCKEKRKKETKKKSNPNKKQKGMKVGAHSLLLHEAENLPSLTLQGRRKNQKGLQSSIKKISRRNLPILPLKLLQKGNRLSGIPFLGHSPHHRYPGYLKKRSIGGKIAAI